MSSSVRSSPDPRDGCRHRRGGGAALVALACLLAAVAPERPRADELAAVAPAGGAIAECSADAADADAVSRCLESTEQRVAQALGGVLATATAHFADLDLISGNQRASRTLAQGQAAFELYRDLDCHLAELAQGVSAAADDHRRACRIDHDRARIARLAALLPVPPEATPPAPPATGEGSMILGTAWRAVDIDGEPVADGVEITLAIDAAAAVNGRGGCNRYFGTAEIGGETIDFGALGSTRMACPDPAMSEERRYFQALEAVTAWRLVDDRLELLDHEETVRVRLEPAGA